MMKTMTMVMLTIIAATKSTIDNISTRRTIDINCSTTRWWWRDDFLRYAKALAVEVEQGRTCGPAAAIVIWRLLFG